MLGLRPTELLQHEELLDTNDAERHRVTNLFASTTVSLHVAM